MLLYLKDIMCKPHGNHKAKTYSRFTKDKEKEIKAYQYGKSLIHKERQQERKKGTNEL